MELVGKDQPVSNPPIWKYRSGIGDHRFTFFMDLFPNYTFYTNLTILFIWVFAYRRCDKPDNVQLMKSWEKYAKWFDAGLSEIHTFSFKKMHLKLSHLFRLGLYELNTTRHGLSRHDPNHSSYPCHFRYQPVLSVAAWPLVRIRSMPNLRSWERTGGNGRGPRGPRGPLGCTTAPGWAVKVPGSGITLGCKRSAMKNEVLLRASL